MTLFVGPAKNLEPPQGSTVSLSPEDPAAKPDDSIGQRNDVAGLVAYRVSEATIFLGIICFLMVLYALYVTQVVVLPLMLAILLKLVLSPLIRLMARWRIPEPLGAGLTLLAILGLGIFGLYTLSGPATDWLGKLPATVHELRPQLRDLERPFERAGQMINDMSAAPGQTQAPKGSADAPSPTVGTGSSVRIGLSVASASGIVLFGLLSTIVLLYFLLASGDMFLRKLVTLIPNFRDKKRAVEIARKIQTDVSTYLVTITVINLALGTAVAGAMWATGLPNPPLWGGMVAVLNFVPYLGPLVSFTVISLASIATFKSFGAAWPSPVAFLVLVTLEGQFLTPMLAARRLTLNPIAIFIAISFCGFLWNVPGALLAVPLLAVTKIICDNMRILNPIGEFLGN